MTDRLFTALHLLLLTAISAMGVDLFYGVVISQMPQPQETRTFVATLPQDVANQTKGNPLSHYAVIDQRNLFKLADQTEEPVKAEVETTIDVESLAETRLRLKLWGTISGQADEYSRAIIEDETMRKQDLYRVGDAVQDAEIKLILRDRVVMTYQGRDEVLRMEADKSGLTTSKRPTSEAPARELPPSSITKRVSLSRQTIDDAMANISTLMKDVRIQPHFRNGQPRGMAVSGIKSDSIFRKMGIRNGDIILGVDGQKIESVDDAMVLYGSVRSATEIKLDIERLGQVQTIEYSIE